MVVIGPIVIPTLKSKLPFIKMEKYKGLLINIPQHVLSIEDIIKSSESRETEKALLVGIIDEDIYRFDNEASKCAKI